MNTNKLMLVVKNIYTNVKLLDISIKQIWVFKNFKYHNTQSNKVGKTKTSFYKMLYYYNLNKI